MAFDSSARVCQRQVLPSVDSNSAFLRACSNLAAFVAPAAISRSTWMSMSDVPACILPDLSQQFRHKAAEHNEFRRDPVVVHHSHECFFGGFACRSRSGRLSCHETPRGGDRPPPHLELLRCEDQRTSGATRLPIRHPSPESVASSPASETAKEAADPPPSLQARPVERCGAFPLLSTRPRTRHR